MTAAVRVRADRNTVNRIVGYGLTVAVAVFLASFLTGLLLGGDIVAAVQHVNPATPLVEVVAVATVLTRLARTLR